MQENASTFVITKKDDGENKEVKVEYSQTNTVKKKAIRKQPSPKKSSKGLQPTKKPKNNLSNPKKSKRDKDQDDVERDDDE